MNIPVNHRQNGGSSSDDNGSAPPAIRKGWRSMTRSAQIKAKSDFESMIDDIEIDKPKLLRERPKVYLVDILFICYSCIFQKKTQTWQGRISRWGSCGYITAMECKIISSMSS